MIFLKASRRFCVRLSFLCVMGEMNKKYNM